MLEKLLDLVDVPLPEAVVEGELQARREQIQQQLAMAGMTMEQYLDSEKQTVDEFEADLEKRVRDAVAAQFVLDQVAKQESVGVNEGELQQHVMQRAQQSGQNPQEFIQHMLEHDHMPEMVSEVVRGKALATIVESATVTDESGNHVELKNLPARRQHRRPGGGGGGRGGARPRRRSPRRATRRPRPRTSPTPRARPGVRPVSHAVTRSLTYPGCGSKLPS